MIKGLLRAKQRAQNSIRRNKAIASLRTAEGGLSTIYDAYEKTYLRRLHDLDPTKEHTIAQDFRQPDDSKGRPYDFSCKTRNIDTAARHLATAAYSEHRRRQQKEFVKKRQNAILDHIPVPDVMGLISEYADEDVPQRKPFKADVTLQQRRRASQ
ncbi:MAG: hypothetical protein IPO08_23920 [Xanthomonadales bacterium]|nr:hypothetical protein [Xanthomonadales bacterium]